MPLESTVAIAVRFELHATALPVRTFPSASSGVAVSCTDCPGATLAVDGVMETLATGAGGLVTVTLDVPDTPAVEAVVVAVPTPAPATRPFELTVATVPLLLVQANVCPDTTLPPASCAVAVS
jgi:hypothetical protein